MVREPSVCIGECAFRPQTPNSTTRKCSLLSNAMCVALAKSRGQRSCGSGAFASLAAEAVPDGRGGVPNWGDPPHPTTRPQSCTMPGSWVTPFRGRPTNSVRVVTVRGQPGGRHSRQTEFRLERGRIDVRVHEPAATPTGQPLAPALPGARSRPPHRPPDKPLDAIRTS